MTLFPQESVTTLDEFGTRPKISGAADDIAINAGVMIIDAQELLIEIAAAAHDQLPRSDFWDFMRNINPNFASTVLDLADAGVFDELADSNFGCAGCIAIVALSTAVAISFGASAICGAMISTVIFAATCGFFVAELIGYIDDAGQITQTGAEGFCGSVAGVC
ncbi:hypothetical protein RBH26_17090 [Natronolimnohabitans sp. A-GB9]|uniref:hypothetical protein n=1 Tax=Natronolimnohabitans sp. A-GB9 TaxID=3069757 RepID=UPI0027B13D64|nr:hypothetical protein [Natronolimnohabitans sp. A-GB9]MDQ2052196.1 hypothetical protein [Natronolimnohabitans sp. A-GB9]